MMSPVDGNRTAVDAGKALADEQDCGSAHFIRSCRPLLLADFNGIAVACRFDIGGYAPTLFDELGIPFPEALAKARDTRCAEFLAGRYAARCAMRYLQRAEADVPIAADRSPVWPEGASASISHSGDLAICAMSRDGSPVGIDLERRIAQDIALEIQHKILSLPEQRLLRQQFGDYAEGFTLAFSAKESVYKALYPRLRRVLDFMDVEIAGLDTDARLLSLAPGPGLRREFGAQCRFHIRWDSIGDYLLSYAPREFIGAGRGAYWYDS